MPKSKTSLNELLYDIRRIEEHREVLTQKKIKAMYRSLMKDLNAYLAEGYLKYADADGRFYIAYLDAQNKRAKFLQEIVENVDNLTPQLEAEITALVEDVYTESYKGMVEAVKAAETPEKLAEITQDIDVRPEVLNQAVNNNISKLTLPAVLEKHRAEIVYQIMQTLTIGLMNGDRYEKMAKRISERVGVSQSKAMNITRTETHRNAESGFMDCAENIQRGMEGSDFIYAATWHNMGDERVRPQQMRKTKSGWKHSWSKNGADHLILEGQTIKVGDKFDLGYYNGRKITARAPSESGVAAHDCNCRCIVEYNLLTLEEFEKAVGKPVYVASMSRTTKQQMNEYGIANLELERTTDITSFDKAIREMKKHGGAAACVDTHPLDELKEFKLYLSKNQMAGVAVKPDGDITCVFKNKDFDVKGGVNDLIITARANGGEKMDCYGSFLVNSYEKCGYVPVARVPFNADYVDDAYLLATKPDVYVMMKNTDKLDDVIAKNAAKSYKLSTQADLDNLLTLDYDDALNYRDMLLAKQNAGSMIDEAAKHYTYSVVKEPKITADLQKAVKNTGGELTGLDFRIKTEKSYTRKVEKEIADINKAAKKRGIEYTATQADAVSNMRDVVRYTSLSAKETLVDDFNEIIGGLEKDGYSLVRVKNTFKPDAPYKGINCILQDADGFNFELQFHTPQSFDLKNGILHELYEKERLVTTPPDVKAALQKQMKEISDSIVFPDNVDKIESFNNIVDILDKIEKKR